MKIGNKEIGTKPGFQRGNKLGVANRGKRRTPEQREKLSRERKGKHFSPKTEFKKGQPAFNKGKPNPGAKNLPQAFKKGQMPHNYKGGVVLIRNKVRSSPEYKTWRTEVFRRDNYTCVLCFARGVYLNADHFPRLFSEIMDEFEVTTWEQALSCEELWDINNGRTLCKECHHRITWGKYDQD